MTEETRTTAYEVLEWVPIKGRGLTLAMVILAEDVPNDFVGWPGTTFTLDGRDFVCVGVERFAHMPPFRKGETIGIAVRTDALSVSSES